MPISDWLNGWGIAYALSIIVVVGVIYIIFPPKRK